MELPANKLKEIERAAVILRNGGVVVFPTDTVFGIGCKWDEEKAIERIYKIKGRPTGMPFPILVSKIEQVREIARMTPQGEDLISRYWPGALTIILENKDKTGKIGFRMPKLKVTLELISKSGFPVIGTSANLHGKRPVVSYGQLDSDLVESADFVIRGKCPGGGAASTVVDATVDPPAVIRQGAVILFR